MEVITDPEVDAVWICSPSKFHAEQIKAAAANGKHVFCEKPIATDLGETVEAINACNEAGVKLMTGLQRRFDDNFRRVREAVEKKEVGETIMVSSSSAFILVYISVVCLFVVRPIFLCCDSLDFRSSCAPVILLHHPSLT
jgi:predicted dehydrogenase